MVWDSTWAIVQYNSPDIYLFKMKICCAKADPTLRARNIFKYICHFQLYSVSKNIPQGNLKVP
jgi:hypothetical protein